MPIDRDDHDDRIARIEQTLEALKRAVEEAREVTQRSRQIRSHGGPGPAPFVASTPERGRASQPESKANEPRKPSVTPVQRKR
jgi:hypothetical protein